MAIPLDPRFIPKFVNPLVVPPVYEPDIVKSEDGNVRSHDYTVTMSEFCQQILPPEFPATTVWGYGGRVRDFQTGEIVPDFQHTPGATFEAVRGIPINVKWMNLLTEPHALPVDP
ncbi:MAG TPA: copper oxidase, partial [Verrucomicrobiae bacterium]|nr:copper oxidase [Verrucomicrobiae bacterium]